MRDDEILLMPGNGLEEHVRVVVFVRRGEVILMKFHRHPDARRHDLPQEIHVGEHPLVADGRDPEVPLEESVEAVEEELDGSEEVVRRRAEGATPQEAEREAEGNEGGVFPVIGNVRLRRRDVGVTTGATLGAVADPLVVDVAERLTCDAG